MPQVTAASAAGLVLQKDMLDASTEIAAVLQVSHDGGDKSANAAIAALEAADAAEEARALAAEAAIQADVDQNEADGDADRALIRTEFAAADAAIQSELDASQAGAGLSAAGAYVVSAGANYIAAATSLSDADDLLDAAVKAEETARIAAVAAVQADVDQNEADGDADRALIRTEFAAADAAIQSELDASQAGAGLSAAGAYQQVGGANYIAGATSLHEADIALDAALKVEETARAAEDLLIRADFAAADAAIQADVDQNEADGDADRALIRTEFAAADALIQGELDDTQAGAGLAADGSYVANGAMNYISTAASLFEADEKLDVEVKSNADAIVAEAAARAAADTALQSELDASQAGAGLDAAGAYVVNAGANFIAAATSLSDADDKLDAALKAEEVARIAADAAISAEVAKTSFTHTGNKEGKLVLEDTTTGFTQVTMDFALVNGTVQLTLS